jgi:hypothetical protein
MTPSARVYTIDRFEGDVAVLDASPGGTISVPRSSLPPGTREGDVVQSVSWNGCGQRFALVQGAAEELRGRASGEVEDLEKSDPGGDLAL